MLAAAVPCSCYLRVKLFLRLAPECIWQYEIVENDVRLFSWLKKIDQKLP